MKYSLNIIKIVVSLCIFLNAATLTHASIKEQYRKEGKNLKQKQKEKQRQRQSNRGENKDVVAVITEIDSTNVATQITSCNTPIVNSTTPTPPPAPALTFGAWFDAGQGVENTQTLTAGTNTSLLFTNPEVSDGITNVAGTFIFSQSGIYRVEVAVVASDAAPAAPEVVVPEMFIFQLMLNGVDLPGGVLEVQDRSPFFSNSLNFVSVLIQVTAGSQLALKYIGSCSANPCESPLGTDDVHVGPSQSPGGTSAFITIEQIR